MSYSLPYTARAAKKKGRAATGAAGHCRGSLRRPCSFDEACSLLPPLGRTTINPFTGRRLRSKVRAGLTADCKRQRASSPRARPAAAAAAGVVGGGRISLAYFDFANEEHEVWFDKRVISGLVAPDPKHRFGIGAYWTVYADAANPNVAIKIRPAFTEAEVRTIEAEAKVYRLAAANGVGPKVYDWFFVEGKRRKKGGAGLRGARGDRLISGVAVAVVERYQQEVDHKVKCMPSYAKLLADLKARVADFESRTGIANKEPWQPRNLFVDLARGDVSRIVVGDWGSYNKS